MRLKRDQEKAEFYRRYPASFWDVPLGSRLLVLLYVFLALAFLYMAGSDDTIEEAIFHGSESLFFLVLGFYLAKVSIRTVRGDKLLADIEKTRAELEVMWETIRPYYEQVHTDEQSKEMITHEYQMPNQRENTDDQ